ncbi:MULTISPECIES: astroprincin family protein [Acinetobacter]|jgi:hypothetical protein|uniref:Carboxypeptidase regulatory-like domain-containing protein n=2 Tax=Bacteria TaxID=2 RepID=A0ABX9TV89_9GAMM|nr:MULTISPECIES: astroprincin family protein [Acinetobacter]MBI1451811.1 hypothetical protein [Acinetobacter sp. FL51]RKG44145.1 hypothetical protein D7V31_02410 [Acinetobacter sp. WCHAc060007]RLL21481.1 hypothetical protein D9K81_09605 [Acinetobacter chengduensis]
MKLKQHAHAVMVACILGVPLVGCGSGSSDGSSHEAIVEKSVSALVQTATGSALVGTEINIDGQSFMTDASGHAAFKVKLAQSAKTVVVSFKKAGFITQSVELKVDELAQISANLLPIKQSMTVAKIEDAQVIQSALMNAQISIPANAFVLPNGQPATGAVTVELTPWDIQSSDLNAMPANGVAIDDKGNPATLISAGMLTATFTDSTGQKLQLKTGVSADIQMDLPRSSVNNQAMTVGTSIPMWYFDVAKGKWIEEGTPGTVVASPLSETGLAVKATVSHFSTWNWDFKFENPGSVNVKCKSASSYVPCHITAWVELKDGSGLTKTTSISENGVDIINMPTEGQIHWSAKDTTGTLIGSVTSQLPNDKTVVIDLGVPATSNKVQCVLENGTAVECSGEFTTKVGTTYQAAEFTAPKEGVRVMTGLKSSNDQLVWSAKTALTLEAGQWVRYMGATVSTSKADVKITLKDKEVVAADQGLSFYVQCTSGYDYNTGKLNLSDPALVGKPCEIEVNLYLDSFNSTAHQLYFSVPYGEKKLIRLPNQYAGFEWLGEGKVSSLYVQGRMLQGTYCGSAGTEGFKRSEPPLMMIALWGGNSPVELDGNFCIIPS